MALAIPIPDYSFYRPLRRSMLDVQRSTFLPPPFASWRLRGSNLFLFNSTFEVKRSTFNVLSPGTSSSAPLRALASSRFKPLPLLSTTPPSSDPPVDLQDLKRKSVRGGMVTMASQGVSIVVQLASTVILARSCHSRFPQVAFPS